MKVVMVMFDSVNRHMLPPYGCDWIKAPNFARLAKRSSTFDKSYVCSMPCMPARRELHTARPNFLHRTWGPIEPFDDSVPQMLSAAGVYTHLCSDHYHYWEDGGATYHNRYTSWECFRGQEGDPCIGQVADPPIPHHINGKGRRSDWVNRQYQQRDEDLPQTKTFDAGITFLERNHDQDRWFLQIECFDPHEPFWSGSKYHDLYPHDYDEAKQGVFDWPGYGPVEQTPEQIEHLKLRYAALLSKCDESLGRVLDAFDKHDLWKDTMLVVCTDHGFMLGEHQMLAKNWMGWYEETAHTPLMIWDPRCPEAAGQRRAALVQPMIDLGPTLLSFFGLQPTPDMLGHDLTATIANDAPVRDAAIWGMAGSAVHVTDGRYTYMRWPVREGNGPWCNYTLMPTNMRGFLARQQLENATLVEPLSFTKGLRVLRLGRAEAQPLKPDHDKQHRLWDLENDPQQNTPLHDAKLEDRMIDHMVTLMKQCDAPPEAYQRMGLEERI